MLSDEQKNKIDAMVQAGDWKALVKYCKPHMDKPDNAVWLLPLGLALLRLKNYDNAVEIFERCLPAYANDATFFAYLGEACARAGDSSKGMRYLREAIRIKPYAPIPLFQLATLHAARKEYDKALDMFQRLIQVQPDYVEAHHQMAMIYVQLEAPEKAITYFRWVLRRDSEHIETKKALGILLAKSGGYREAISLLTGLCEKPQREMLRTWTEIPFFLGSAHHALGDLDQADRYYEMASRNLNPYQAQSEFNLGLVYLAQGRFKAAQTRFASAAKTLDHDATVRHMYEAAHGITTTKPAREFVEQLFDQYAPYYDAHMIEALEYKVPALIRSELSPYAVAFQEAPWTAIDLGCGTGLCSVYLSDLVGRFIGIDLSPRMLEAAKQRNTYDALIQGDIESVLPRYKERANLIVAGDVFVYFGDLKNVLSLCYQALKADGLLVFTVEMKDPKLEDVKKKTKNECADNQDYVIQYSGRYQHTKKYIIQCLKDAGFYGETDVVVLPKEFVLRKGYNDSEVFGYLWIVRKPEPITYDCTDLFKDEL